MTESTGGRPSIGYALTIDCAKEISMLHRSDKDKQARLYFIEVEKEYKAITTPLTSFDLFDTQVKFFKNSRQKCNDK